MVAFQSGLLYGSHAFGKVAVVPSAVLLMGKILTLVLGTGHLSVGNKYC